MTTFSASRFGSLWVARATTVSRSQIFLPVSWSIPAYTFTRAEPHGSQPIVPRWRPREGREEAMAQDRTAVEATKEATRTW